MESRYPMKDQIIYTNVRSVIHPKQILSEGFEFNLQNKRKIFEKKKRRYQVKWDD